MLSTIDEEKSAENSDFYISISFRSSNAEPFYYAFFRRLEQVLHVHPEKYQNPERFGRFSSRHSTPVDKTRSGSAEYTL
ncbi:unnamed protein product [Heligmosomoides polygyrus]|uniref:J domain-containing protein n=1 Tax=Heligmosomoides polygyrus TaxID=6339 RepID=A0A183GBU6_HELPZ|nr:unnamed protein product [Heligmosomoides polygyrus]